MTGESRDADRELAALAEAMHGLTEAGEVQGIPILLEKFLDTLSVSEPETAILTAAAMEAVGGEDARELASVIRSRVGEAGAIQSRPINPIPLDLLLLTPKENEFSACLDAFEVPSGSSPTSIGRTELWEVEWGERRLGIAVIGTEGNAEASIEIGKLSVLAKFPAAILVGMAAGDEDQVDLGDVVVASSVMAYEFVRLTQEGVRPRFKTYSCNQRVIQKIATLKQVDPEWADRVAREVCSGERFTGGESAAHVLLETWRSKVKPGVVLAGSQLVEDGSLSSLRDQTHERVMALEMEGAGFALACSGDDKRWMIIRGIADFGEGDRPDKAVWQYAATYAAAAFVRDQVLTGRVPLLERDD